MVEVVEEVLVLMLLCPRRWTRSCRRTWSRSAANTARSVLRKAFICLPEQIFSLKPNKSFASFPLQVSNIVVYQEKQDETADAEIVVKIFVEMNTAMDVKRAKNALDGRWGN